MPTAGSILRLYVGHKLTNADPLFLARMEEIRRVLEHGLAGEFEVLKFLGLGEATNVEVYRRDIEGCVAMCDLFVAFVDQESTGLGFELATALWKYGAPILLINFEGSRVSRLILGAAEVNHEAVLHKVVSDSSEVIGCIHDAARHFCLQRLDHSGQRAGHDAVSLWPFTDELPFGDPICRDTSTV